MSGPDTEIYGGNTACVQVAQEDSVLLLDAGTGLHRVNIDSYTGNRIDILLTHLHLDHILGLGFFKPLFDPSAEVHIWGPASSAHSLQQRLHRYLSPPLFPVRLRDLPCKLCLHEIEDSCFEIGPFTIHSRYLIHAGPTVGYRVTTGQSVLCYIPDHEPALAPRGMLSDIRWVSGIDVAMDADLLIHDSQYNVDEYRDKIGWGHSSMKDAAFFASLARAKKLILFHHDPAHSDAQLNEMFSNFLKVSNYDFEIDLAREGMEFELQ
jgi:ribonuclease BN (tRNA processing enzyme)